MRGDASFTNGSVRSTPNIDRLAREGKVFTMYPLRWHMGGGRNIDAPAITQYGFDAYSSTWESPDPDPLLTSTNWIWAPSDSIKRWERKAYFIDKSLNFLEQNQGMTIHLNGP